ncbi:hypothetical protein TNCV_2315201 [Trichonephila clavipes]|nr:hypothetical protein TNCV_2315201 [Trichonephila clavipes]
MRAIDVSEKAGSENVEEKSSGRPQASRTTENLEKVVTGLFEFACSNYLNIYVMSPQPFKCQSRTPTAGSDVVQSGRQIFDDFFPHLWPFIGNNTANVVFQMVKRLWLIRIDQ